jgi:hypothetical protein
MSARFQKIAAAFTILAPLFTLGTQRPYYKMRVFRIIFILVVATPATLAVPPAPNFTPEELVQVFGHVASGLISSARALCASCKLGCSLILSKSPTEPSEAMKAGIPPAYFDSAETILTALVCSEMGLVS